jgi:sulfate transport system permease protein
MARKRSEGVKGLLRWSLISISFVLFFVIVLLPLSSMFTFAFEDGPGGFVKAISTKEAVTAFKNSIILATLTTVINMGAGTLIGFVITRYKFPGRQIFKALIDMPIAIPTAVVGLALMMLYGPMGLLGPFMTGRGFQLVLALPGVLLAHVFVTFPFMVRSVSVSVEKLDISQEEAAMTLGATRAQTFLHVVLPSIRGGLVAGTALTFTRSLFIAGGMVTTGPLYIYYLSESMFDHQAATSIAIVLMVLPFALLLVLNYLADRMEA